MEIKVISYSKNGKEIHRVTVGEETAIMRMRRSTKQAAQVMIEEEDQDVRLVRIVIYPDCFASVVDWGTFKKPVEFEEFSKLPGKFVDEWATAAWELNPDWQLNRSGLSEEEQKLKDEETEKKVLN